MEVISIPPSDEIICDICNRLIEDEKEEGGSFIGTYSVCPRCTERILKTASDKEKEEIELITGSFINAVRQKRIELSFGHAGTARADYIVGFYSKNNIDRLKELKLTCGRCGHVYRFSTKEELIECLDFYYSGGETPCCDIDGWFLEEAILNPRIELYNNHRNNLSLR